MFLKIAKGIVQLTFKEMTVKPAEMKMKPAADFPTATKKQDRRPNLQYAEKLSNFYTTEILF